MQVLDKTLNAMKDIKKELAGFNEAHLMKLVYQMASRIAKVELEGNNEAIVKILRDAVGLSQDEENITVRVSATQFEFLEKVKLETGREFEFTKRMKFEPSTEIADGGCIVETNYGEVDARIEQRLEQLWSVLSESLPKVKDKVAS
jgi:flagellar assembly protein FliH